MKDGLKVLTVTSAGSSKGKALPSLSKTNPKYFSFLTGIVKGGVPPTFSETGWANIARRFKLSIEEAQAYADTFIAEGGCNE